MDKRQVMGLVGSAALFVGVFAPLVNLPLLGSMNYLQYIEIGGIFLIILAITSLILTLRRDYGGLWITGLISLGMVALPFIDFQVRKSQPGSSAWLLQFVQFTWGWALLLVGAILVIAAAAVKGTKQNKACLNNHPFQNP